MKSASLLPSGGSAQLFAALSDAGVTTIAPAFVPASGSCE